LLAILLVAIATILAAAIGYGSAMSARRAAATIAFDEGLLVGQAAEALAAFGLRADLRAGAEYDYPGRGVGETGRPDRDRAGSAARGVPGGCAGALQSQ
jgi:hypothetical protein